MQSQTWLQNQIQRAGKISCAVQAAVVNFKEDYLQVMFVERIPVGPGRGQKSNLKQLSSVRGWMAVRPGTSAPQAQLKPSAPAIELSMTEQTTGQCGFGSTDMVDPCFYKYCTAFSSIICYVKPNGSFVNLLIRTTS